ncbi:MAG: hypothetical protein MJZ81_07595 [Bacteroidales bacterium]|nr:hypothetical protein [Bacteroidales bacterium]
MKISEKQAVDRTVRYMTERLLPSASTVGKFKIGFAMPLVPQMVEQYWGTGRDLGLVDAEGLDVGRLEECLMAGINQAGSLPIRGFIMKEQDVRDFMSYLNA